MKFYQVDPNAIEAQGIASTRGGIIGPIIEGFLKTGYYMAEVDCSEIGRKTASVSASVAAYAKNHIAPVRPILRQPRLYLQRRDIDKDGNPIEDWKEELLAMHVEGTGYQTVPTPLITIEAFSLEDQAKAKQGK
jgi:hypothetical protein